MTAETLAAPLLTADEIAAALADWTIRTHRAGAPAWRAIRARKTRFYWRKRAKRLVRELLPFIRARETERDPAFVEDHYTETWSRYHWPDPDEPPRKENTVFLEWDGTGYEALRHGLVRCHLLGIARAVERLAPASALEVGAGPGMNLVALAGMFPDMTLAGVELTPSGVAAARAAQAEALPAAMERFAPFPIQSRTAHQRVDFRQGDARAIPFADESFDLVYTRLAVEQMERIRDAALAEIHRVARAHAVFVEPFADFNRAGLRRLATKAKNYISLSLDELPRHGFEPVLRFSDWPHKITNGAGLVLCRKVAPRG